VRDLLQLVEEGLRRHQVAAFALNRFDEDRGYALGGD
jgi:hypothetical protein